jgi:hypothetical protein
MKGQSRRWRKIYLNDIKISKKQLVILAFSELEFGLGIICSFTEFNLLTREQSLPTYLGLTLENKRKTISDYIDKYEPDLKPTWDKIKSEIEFLNKQRRYIAHGIEQVYVADTLRAIVKVGQRLEEKRLTIEEVKKWTDRLHHVNTGDNGVIGEFYLDFARRSINRWNKYVIEDYRITYTVNSEIVSDWKGKGK